MDDVIFRLIKLKAEGFCCAQMLFILALEAEGKTNTDLVKSMGGLCFGLNWSGEVCGALSGGACLISLYAGKGCNAESSDRWYTSMLGQLVEWFTRKADEEYGGVKCNEILERFPDRSMCGRIVADTYARCIDLLGSRGLGPGASKNGGHGNDIPV